MSVYQATSQRSIEARGSKDVRPVVRHLHVGYHWARQTDMQANALALVCSMPEILEELSSLDTCRYIRQEIQLQLSEGLACPRLGVADVGVVLQLQGSG